MVEGDKVQMLKFRFQHLNPFNSVVNGSLLIMLIKS